MVEGRELYSNNTSNRYTYSRLDSNIESYSFDTIIGPEFIFNGYGIINSSLHYDFHIDINLDFAFNWDTLGGDTYLYYTLNANYSLSLKHDLYFVGIIEVKINDFIQIGRYY